MRVRCSAFRSLGLLFSLGLGACGPERAPAESPTTAGTLAASSAAPEPTASGGVDVPDAAPPPSAKAPMLELQKKAIHGMVDAFNAHDEKALAAFYAPNAVVRSPSSDGFKEETGREPIEKGHAGLFRQFPDVKVGTQVVYASGNVAIWTWITGGTDSVGGANGPATKRQFGFYGASVLTFGADGLVTEDHTYFNVLAMVGQLGKLPKGMGVYSVTSVPEKEYWWRETKGSDTEKKSLETVKNVHAALARGDDKTFLALVDESAELDQLGAPDSDRKAKGKAGFAAFQKSFRQPKIVAERTFATDLNVVSEVTLEATHAGAGGAGGKRPVTLHFLEITSMTNDGAWVLGASTYDNRAELTPLVAPQKAPAAAKK